MFAGHRLGKAKIVVWLLVCATILLLPKVIQNAYLYFMLSMLGTYIIFGLGLNLFWGHCGQISFGHQAFYGIGAYTAVLLARNLDWPFVLPVIGGGLFAAVVSVVVGFAILRLRAVYLALGTFAFAMAVFYVFEQWTAVTNGINGLAVPMPDMFGHSLGKEGLYYMIAIFTMAAYLGCSLLIRSRVGRAFRSIRDNEVAAGACGVNVFWYRLMAFGLSAFLTGLAGGLYAYSPGWISSQDFGAGLAVIALTIVVVGGLGSNIGQVLGAIFVVFVPELLYGLQQWRVIVYGASVGLVVLFLPEGLSGGLTGIVSRMSRWLVRRVPAEAD